jgi:hypothetical protein
MRDTEPPSESEFVTHVVTHLDARLGWFPHWDR